MPCRVERLDFVRAGKTEAKVIANPEERAAEIRFQYPAIFVAIQLNY
jgi:hypothetical protein